MYTNKIKEAIYFWDFLEFGIGCVVGVVENDGHAHRYVTSTRMLLESLGSKWEWLYG